MQNLFDTFLGFLKHLKITDVIPIQFPIVLCLLILCIQAYKILNIQEFKFIAFAWGINIVYLIFNLGFHLYSYDNLVSSILITFLNLLNTYLLFCAIKPRFNRLRKIPNPFIWIVFIFAGICSIIPTQDYNQFYIRPTQPLDYLPSLILQNIPASVLNFFVLLFVAFFFKKLIKQFHQPNFLLYGTFLYAAIQLLTIPHPDLNILGVPTFSILFSLGLLAKFTILLFLSVLLITVGKEFAGQEEIAKKLDNILGITFHEINYPLDAIDSYLKVIAPEDKKSTPHHINKYKEVAHEIRSSYFHMVAIISASIKMYETDIGKHLDPEFVPNSNIKTISEAISVNTLIEIAILKIKPFIHDSVNFISDFGGNCIINCNSTEIAQVFLNLFKNSCEAFPLTDQGKNQITIKTRIFKIEAENKSSSKSVLVEITDNGSGIDESIKNNIFEIGSSTKISNSRRGFGMAIIKQLVENNHGTISFESPISDETVRRGTRFILTFIHS